MRLDRSDIGRMKINRTLIWAFQVALVLLCLALSLKIGWSTICCDFSPLIEAIGVHGPNCVGR